MKKCTCKKSDHVDEDWCNFLVMDKNCPKHGFKLKPLPTIEKQRVNLFEQLEAIV